MSEMTDTFNSSLYDYNSRQYIFNEISLTLLSNVFNGE